MNKEKAKKSKRCLEGKIVSDKMDKTVVVLINRSKMHKKYGKSFRISKKYKAHDEKNEYHTADEVVIEETRPISREKRWRVKNKLSKK